MMNSSENKVINNNLLYKIRSTDENKRDILYIILIYIAGVIFYFLLSKYSKVVALYMDELLYYDIAGSIFQGTGLLVRGANLGFTKIGYSLLIAPLFAIDNIELRITMIALLNSIVMMSSVIPAFLIAREVGMKRGTMYLYLLVALFWPGMLMSATFMSEVLYFPLMWFFVYFWLKEQKSPDNIVYPILEGIICFLGYLTKEVFLSVFVAYYIVKLMYPVISAIIQSKEKKENIRSLVFSGFSLKKLRNAVIFGVVFAVLCKLSSAAFLTFFNAGNLYAGAISSVTNSLSIYIILYFVYGIIVYLSGVAIAVFVFPVVYPLIMFKHMGELVRKLICFAYVNLFAAIAAISYTILIKEELGNEVMRIHFRYISPDTLLILFLFFVVISDRTSLFDFLKEHKFMTWISVIVTAIASLMLYKGSRKNAFCQQYELTWFELLRDKIGSVMPDNGAGMPIPLFSIVIGIVMLALIVVIQLLLQKKRCNGFYVGVTGVLILMGSVNLYYGRIITMQKNAAEKTYIVEAEKINNFIRTAPEDTQILYIMDKEFEGSTLYADTYFDKSDNIVFMNNFSIRSLSANESVPIRYIEFRDPVWDRKYDRVDHFDYIICASKFGEGLRCFSGVELLSEFSGNKYRLYKNLDNTTLDFEYDRAMYFDGSDRIVDFCSEDNEALSYITAGILLPEPEEDYAWTDGNLLLGEIPVVEGLDNVYITFNCVDTFNGAQRYIVRQDYNIISQGLIDETGIISFMASVKDNVALFEIEFPDAAVISEINGGDDDRNIAVAICNMEISSFNKNSI